MLDWILSQNCRNTLPFHTVDQLVSSAKNERLVAGGDEMWENWNLGNHIGVVDVKLAKKTCCRWWGQWSSSLLRDVVIQTIDIFIRDCYF